MKNSNLLLLATLFVALTLLSCDKDDSTQTPVETEIATLDPSSGKSIKGFAADGASTIEVKVTFGADITPTAISITPEQSGFGVFSTSMSTEVDYVVTSEDLDRGYATFYLQSEESMPSELSTSSVATFKYNISIATTEEDILKTMNIEVVRPPVILAHGFGSDRSTYDPMLSYITPKGLYVDSGIYALDYSVTSLSSYVVNKSVIPNAIDYTKFRMLLEGYVFEKATVVGHSMGGVLTRLYMQGCYDVDYRDDILKVIAIDSPFTGTQLADFGVALADKYPDSPLKLVKYIGAIIDFQVGSEATVDVLNGASYLNKTILPTHIISATFGDTKSIASLISSKQYVQALLTFIVQKIATENIYGEDNDLIVPISSQICGVEDSIRKDYVTTYSGEWHCSVHTTEEVSSKIVELLDTPSTDSGSFSTDGFAPTLLSYDSGNHSSITMSESSNITSVAQTILTIGLDIYGNIVDMGYKSTDDSIEISNDAVVDRYTIGVTSDSSILYSLQ